MSTRAQQFDVLATGVQYNAALITVPYVKFLNAGLSSTKDAYEDKDKAVAITKKALDSQGRATVYGDGVYKLEFYTGDPDSGGTKLFELDNQKCVAVFGNTRTVTAASVAGSVDDAAILADTTSNTITYTMPDATLMESRSIVTKKTVAANTFTIAAASGQTVDGAATVSITGANAAIEWFSNGANWYGKQLVGDASTLDGVASSGYVKTDGTNAITSAIDIAYNSRFTKQDTADEGGQFLLQKPDTGTTLTSDVVADIKGDLLRIFDAGGTNKGAYLDMSTLAVSSATKLWHSENDGTGSGLDADTLDGVEASGFVRAQTAGGINVKIVDIGDWNMDSTLNVSVIGFGILPAKIRDVSVTIRNDAADTYVPIDYRENVGGTTSGAVLWTSTAGDQIVLYRTAGGYFDGVDFDSTSYNRGWVTIYYVD